MKPYWISAAFTLALATLACAQDTTGDRIVVPAGSSSRPRVVTCHLLAGSITVKTHAGNDVIVEAEPSAKTKEKDKNSNGMKRIGMNTRGLDVRGDDNQITVQKTGGAGNLTITVPVETSLRLHTLSGPITVDGVHGEIDVHDLNGAITLTNVSGAVSADSQNGAIKANIDRVDSGKPLAFSTLNGPIDLTLPADLKANLSVRTNHGPVYSDFDVLLGPNRVLTEKNTSSDGKFRIRTDNTISATINGGGVDLNIHTFNGGVYLRKKK